MVFHHEQAGAPLYPSKLFFYCETPATTGGGTGISPSWTLYEQLKAAHPDFVDRCAKLGVIYKGVLPPVHDTTKVRSVWVPVCECVCVFVYHVNHNKECECTR